MNNQFGFSEMITRGNVCVKRASRFTLGKEKLYKLKLRALRCGVWFKALNMLDRALVDVTMKVVDEVRSFRLTKTVLSVVKKLEDALESEVSYALRNVGFPLACKLSLLAQKWGNSLSQNWASDISFAKFLAIMHINNSERFNL
jgi:hypothetical protein